jgi:uncharacterized membrane protein YdjX (TVP38/TMEM64 family)
MSTSNNSGFQWEKWLPLILSITIIGGLLLFYFLHDGFNAFAKEAWTVLTSEDQDRASRWVEQFSFWGPLILIGGFILQMFAFVIPSWLLLLVCILAYGPIWGSALAFAGIGIASTLAYFIGRYVGEHTLQKMIGGKSERKMKTYLEEYGFWLVAIFRMAPFLSNDTISFVAGLLRMTYWRFIAATYLGITPLIVLIAYLGETNDRLKEGFIWASVISLVGFGLYIWWDRRHSKDGSDNEEG